MAVPYYNVGTATLTAGSAKMYGQGTLWSGNVRPGDQAISYSGQTAIVASIEGNGEITFTRPYRGTTQTAQVYEIVYTPDDPFTQQLARGVLQSISGSALVGLGGVAPAARKLPYFDATGAAALADLTDQARTLLARTDIKADNLAPIHVGDRDVSNSSDAQVLISRTIAGGTGNSHGFSDSSLFSRDGYAYNSFDARMNFSGGNFDHYVAFQASPAYGAAGTMGNLSGFYSGLSITSGTINEYYGLWVANPTGAGSIGTAYGVYIAPLTKGTVNNWAIFAEGTTPSYIGGAVGIGARPETGYSLLVKGAAGGGRIGLKSSADAAGSTGMEIASGATISYLWQYNNTPFQIGTNNIERVRVASSGEVTMPFQPTFHAVGGLAFTGGGVVDFSTALLNRGSVYNTSNGRFTAPVAGAYLFAMNILCLGDANCEFAFYKNGSIAAAGGKGNVKNAVGLYGQVFLTAIINLVSNDYVQVYSTVATTRVNGDYRNFSGFLVG